MGVISQVLLKRADGPGRIPAFEVLMVNHAISNLIREGKSFQIPSIMQTSRREGMIMMSQYVRDLIAGGYVTAECEAGQYLEETGKNKGASLSGATGSSATPKAMQVPAPSAAAAARSTKMGPAPYATGPAPTAAPAPAPAPAASVPASASRPGSGPPPLDAVVKTGFPPPPAVKSPPPPPPKAGAIKPPTPPPIVITPLDGGEGTNSDIQISVAMEVEPPTPAAKPGVKPLTVPPFKKTG